MIQNKLFDIRPNNFKALLFFLKNKMWKHLHWTWIFIYFSDARIRNVKWPQLCLSQMWRLKIIFFELSLDIQWIKAHFILSLKKKNLSHRNSYQIRTCWLNLKPASKSCLPNPTWVSPSASFSGDSHGQEQRRSGLFCWWMSYKERSTSQAGIAGLPRTWWNATRTALQRCNSILIRLLNWSIRRLISPLLG